MGILGPKLGSPRRHVQGSWVYHSDSPTTTDSGVQREERVTLLWPRLAQEGVRAGTQILLLP